MSNKTKKNSSRKSAAEAPQKNADFLPLLAVAAVVICADALCLESISGE